MSPGVTPQERYRAYFVPVLDFVVQEVARLCFAGNFVSRAMVAFVGRRPVVFALYQAQAQYPRTLARLHSRENGIVWAPVGACA